jgi:hypothetical protein
MLDDSLLTSPRRISINPCVFVWRRSSYDHSTTPATRFVTYLCGSCLHELKLPFADYTTHLTAHADSHAESDAETETRTAASV